MDLKELEGVLQNTDILEKKIPATEVLKDVEEDDTSFASDVTFMSANDDYISSGDETEEMEDAMVMPPVSTELSIVSERSSDGGYGSSSDEEKGEERKDEKKKEKEIEKEDDKSGVQTSVEVNESIFDEELKEYFEKYHYNEMPPDLQNLLTGIKTGLPKEYSPPADRKPEWFDEKKYRLGQEFARKYFAGVNMSEMLSLYILFALPDGLETLIFTKNSSTPYTSFRRYLSTVVRVMSWYDYDIWDKTTLGYKNIKTVRGMHINVSKKINSTPYEQLKTAVTLAGSTNNAPVWSNLKNVVQKDFQNSFSGCPFQTATNAEKTGPGKVLVNQLDMATTQWGFMGLMVVYPEKFGAARATKEELEGFIHLWRCIGYLLGTEDKYNFCAGSFEEVVERSREIVDKWVRPNFLNVTEEWEHMSRCLAEGMSYVASPEVSFESTLLYMCYVLDVPAPNLYKSLSWGQTFSFYILKFMMTAAANYSWVMAMMNWFARKSIVKATALTAEELRKLEERKYDYQLAKTENKDGKRRNSKWSAKASQLALLLVAGILL